MEEIVIKYVVETELDGEEEMWEEEMWGFEDELSEKMFNEDIFSDVEETGVETKISQGSNNFDEFLAFTLKEADAFFDTEGNEIEKDEFEKNIKESSTCTISVCEVSPTA